MNSVHQSHDKLSPEMSQQKLNFTTHEVNLPKNVSTNYFPTKTLKAWHRTKGNDEMCQYNTAIKTAISFC